MLVEFMAGFALSLSLILAIGAQNAFVLRQGLRAEHVFAVCLTCAISDAVLIAAGVGGMGALVLAAPWLDKVMRFGGVAFLLAYGTMSFRRALRGGAALDPAGEGPRALWPTLAICLALTWGNPHVYLDTLVLVGSVSATYGAGGWHFGAGAMSASLVFFFALGYGARTLRPVFARPSAWVGLEIVVGLTMWAVAAGLIFG